jgi:hypothetical protein
VPSGPSWTPPPTKQIKKSMGYVRVISTKIKLVR